MKLNSSNRIYSIKNPVIAITGGIATGKSFVCKLIKDKGHPVVSADQQIKEIYREQQTFDIINQYAPQALMNDKTVDFSILRQNYFRNQTLQQMLNEYIYPRLEEKIRVFAHSFSLEQHIFYEIPLLYEKNLHHKVDEVILVYAPAHTQRQRIRQRDNSSDETIERILNSQFPIDEKKNKAKYIINNSQAHMKEVHNQLDQILNELLSLT